MDNISEIVRVQSIPYTVGFNWSVGIPMEKFIKALADKKILASKCPGCGYVYTPPRNRCGKCGKEIGTADIIELSGQATLAGYTTARVELDGAGNWKDLEAPKIIGAIKLEGADSTIFMPLEGVAAKALKPGLKLKPGWSEKTEGKISDLKCFKPA
ncbi:MAG TPA: Zn-ribbon domain-containing OB-fold protein [bacterium]|nr:Zn-ribbon domain-containing OB-fold protein [bacterium]